MLYIVKRAFRLVFHQDSHTEYLATARPTAHRFRFGCSRYYYLGGVLAVILVFTCSSISVPAYAGSINVDDDMNAKIARIKAKMRAQRSKSKKNGENVGNSRNSAGCGSLNVGNVVNEKGVRGKQDVTVVITGDVINAGNTCR